MQHHTLEGFRDLCRMIDGSNWTWLMEYSNRSFNVCTRIFKSSSLLDFDVVYFCCVSDMFSSFYEVDYEFKREMKKACELSCVLDVYASSIRNARKLQEDEFKKLI
jgi:hypothetical protein